MVVLVVMIRISKQLKDILDKAEENANKIKTRKCIGCGEEIPDSIRMCDGCNYNYLYNRDNY